MLESTLEHLLKAHGYWAVGMIVGFESIGIPLPGETMLIAASMYAGASHGLKIEGVIAATSLGAFVGDGIGYAIGRFGGARLLSRYAGRSTRRQRRLLLARFLFRRHGGKVVFFGRFVALLRTFAALLAGANHMPWPRFALWNALGGILWSVSFGLGGYFFGHWIRRMRGPIDVLLGAVAMASVVAGAIFVHRNRQRLEEEMLKAMDAEERAAL